MTIGFILDMDGTLVDSTGIIKRIQTEIMKKFNIILTAEREKELERLAESMFQESYSTRLAVKIMWTLLKEVGLTTYQRIKALVLAGKLYVKEVKNLKLYDGIKDLFEFLDNNSHKYIIVTSSSDKTARRYLMKYPKLYNKLNNKIISSDSVNNLKPHPEALEMASKIMGVPYDRIVVVGDTKYDILFGKSVNAITIGVLTGIYTEELLEKLEPDFIFDSVADIPQNIEQIMERINLKNK